MCGIVGFYNPETIPAESRIIREMTSSLVSRGPDGEGHYIDGSLALGHRRLSIIDLEGGSQPLANEDESVWTTFNGELYNFEALRSELQAKGHRFATRSDTEVLVHGYEEYGDDIVQKLNGMFAFAIWDRKKKRLLLARDRFGEKPLYYGLRDGHFAFASEPKSILRHPSFTPEIATEALQAYLTFEYVPAPLSMFRDVWKLPAAHLLVLENGKPSVRRYWDYDEAPVISAPEDEIADGVISRLREAVRLRLMSDVPLGVFLSGGIDSSAILAMMAELMPPARIKTFSIAFDDKSFDESPFAEQVARAFGTEHHVERFDQRALEASLPTMAAYMDEPLGDASLLPTHLLAEFTRRHVTVALGGDGGDELFCGYPTFLARKAAGFYERAPGMVQAWAETAAGLLPVSTDNISFDFKVKQFLRGAKFPDPARNQAWMGSFLPSELPSLLGPAFERGAKHLDPFSLLDDRYNTRREPLQGLTRQYIETYLAEDILTKVDRATMASSLESRAPFLDPDFASYVLRIPIKLRLKGTTGKYILKKSLRGRIPPEILARPKKGFGIPVAKMIFGGLRPLFEASFERDKLLRQGIFDPAYIERLMQQHLGGKKDNRKQLWTLFMFQLWYDNYVEGQL